MAIFRSPDLKIFASSPGKKKQDIKIISAQATHEQNKTNLSAVSSFDSDPNSSGWAVDAGGIGKDQASRL
jgi:hypothetical protein